MESVKRKSSDNSVEEQVIESKSGNCKERKIEKVDVNLLNPKLLEFKDDIKKVYREGLERENLTDFEVICEPFKCATLSNFVNDPEYLNKLRTHLMDDVIYERKNNDLFSFKQTQDFASLDSHLIKRFRQFMLDQALPFLQHVTGIPLYPDEIDINGSKYEYTDVLLCHDDRLDERRIAFILYLVDNWDTNYGGLLDLFDRDENGQPRQVSKSITPEWNKLVFFEVTSNSYHQVSEVLNQSRIRLTINGWFKGPHKPSLLNYYIESPLPEIRCGTVYVDEDIFTDWINPTYLENQTQTEIQKDFSLSSEINLFQFFRPEKYEQLAEALRLTDGWTLLGPPNKRRFEILKESAFPEIVKECIQVMTSEAMFLTLHNYTGLKLHPLAVDLDDSSSDDDNNDDTNQDQSLTADPRCSIQIRRWKKGYYSLLHDEDPEIMVEGPKLDVILHLNHNFQADRDSGGFISYIAKNDEDDLLVIEPDSNFLSLVYMDDSTVRFTKYLNNSHPDTYHDICLVFRQ